MALVYRRSEGRTREWLGVGFDTDQELLRAVRSGKVAATPVGTYLTTVREHFPPDMKLEIGARVSADGPNGPITFTIVTLTETGAVLDANHPLAGKTLHFDVEITEVRTATKEEIEHGHVHGEGGHHH